MAKNDKTETLSLAEVRAQALELAIASVEKTYGTGSVSQFNGNEPQPGVVFTSSGCYSLDRALGGGYPKGRIVEIFGPESSGKTTLSLLAIANAQKADPRKCLFVDMEHALDVSYAQKLGVDVNRVLICQPSSGEEALNMLLTLVKSGAVSLAVVDSVAALVPLKELEGEVGDQNMGLQSRMMSQIMRMLVGPASTSDCCVIFINQIRMKIGVVYGNPETTAGGNALKFYASQRLDVRAGEKEGEEANYTGRMTKVRVIKNKVFPPFREAQFPIEFGIGIDPFKDLVQSALDAGILTQAGAWIKWNGNLVSQGFNKAADYFRSNIEATNELKTALAKK